ncbi:hypothetical protein ACIP9H_33615 [Streptomyces sp. NPDC088732]|uniref:hypothetical protein n=1 Tax=Streptomyces sp. NPDC088732 TaxID=3365879 RepID=UPI0037F57603
MTPEILARITAARTARDLSDLARQAVGITAADMSPAERLIAARRLRKLAADFVDYTVMAEALAGTPWPEIAEPLSRRDPGTVEGEYAESVADWQAMPEDQMTAAAEGAEDLDAWYARHQEDTDPTSETPVTDLLNRR